MYENDTRTMYRSVDSSTCTIKNRTDPNNLFDHLQFHQCAAIISSPSYYILLSIYLIIYLFIYLFSYSFRICEGINQFFFFF